MSMEECPTSEAVAIDVLQDPVLEEIAAEIELHSEEEEGEERKDKPQVSNS